ncbi:hypothetical protein I9W82_002214 [Candida metapsilosis]|uniref:Uncharacterized protein n=1 Tax=Candida metapsilosis TaxID=273372 RepID=A0A8H7ZJB4_9ASCO|nr:hypothetical protein I9W82_002214 [Candida metapsilosis]
MPSLYAANKSKGSRKFTVGSNLNPARMIDNEAQASNNRHQHSKSPIVLPAYIPEPHPSNKQLNDTSSIVTFTTAPYYHSENAIHHTKKAAIESICGNNSKLTTKKYKQQKNTNSRLFVSESKKKYERSVRSLRVDKIDAPELMKFDTAKTSTRFGNTFTNCEEEKEFVSSRANLKNKVIGEKSKNSSLRSKANDNCDRVSSQLKRELSTKWCNLISETSFSYIANNTRLQNKLEEQYQNELTKKWNNEIVQNTSFCSKKPAGNNDAEKLGLQHRKDLSRRDGKSVDEFEKTTTHPLVTPTSDEKLIAKNKSVRETPCAEKLPAVLKKLEAGSNNYVVGAKPLKQVTRVIRFKGDTIKFPRVYRKQPAVLTCLEAGSNSYFAGAKPFDVAQVASKVIRFKGDTIKIPGVCKKQPAVLSFLEAGYNCSVISPDTSVIEEQVATPVIKVKGNRIAFERARSRVESLFKGEVPTHSEHELNVIDDVLEINSPKIAEEIEASESFSTDQSEEPALKLHNDAGTPEIPEINKVLLLLLDIEYKEFLLEHADILQCLAKLENDILETAIAAGVYDDVATKVTNGAAQLELTSNEKRSNDLNLMIKLSHDVAKMKEELLSAHTEFMGEHYHRRVTLIYGDEVTDEADTRIEVGPTAGEVVPNNDNMKDSIDPSRLPSNEYKSAVDEEDSQPVVGKQTEYNIELKSFLNELIELSVIYYDDLPESLKPLVENDTEEEEVSSGDVESKSKDSVEFTPLRLPLNGRKRLVQGEVAQPSVGGPEGHHGDDLLQQV